VLRPLLSYVSNTALWNKLSPMSTSGELKNEIKPYDADPTISSSILSQSRSYNLFSQDIGLDWFMVSLSSGYDRGSGFFKPLKVS